MLMEGCQSLTHVKIGTRTEGGQSLTHVNGRRTVTHVNRRWRDTYILMIGEQSLTCINGRKFNAKEQNRQTYQSTDTFFGWKAWTRD